MGQCIQTAVIANRTHPFLGCLQELQEGKEKLLRLSCPLLNEEEYISWSKNINKLRYSLEIRDYLYLPLRQKFMQSEGMCSSATCLELIFPPYLETLRETLIKNINSGRYFHQSYLWYLIYVLVKYIRHCEKKEHPLNNISLDNLLLFPDGAIKVVPQAILPSQDQASTLYAEIDDWQDSTTQLSHSRHAKTADQLSDVTIVGVICLCVADLIHPTIYYDRARQKWRAVGEMSRREALKNCERRYSALLLQTLAELTEKSKERQIKVESLHKRLELFENEILAKKQLGLGLNLGYSSIESIKTSYCMDNKTVAANNSNLFRLSEVGNDSSHFSGKKTAQEAVQEDFLSIL